MYAKYSDGSLIQLVQAKYARTDPQILSTYHVPLSDINGAIPLGLDWQTWTISGVIADSMSVRWHDIIWLSLDNVAWRACRVQATAFPTNNYQQSTYELTMLVSPILEGAAVRYPASGFKWGNQAITGISQLGNTVAYPTIHYLAPLFYAPLSNTLVDITGQSVTFLRTASKVHGGVTYPINTPIFDSGLYLGSDTAQDVATWTPPASTLRTVAMQLKQTRYPSPWSIGGGGVNLLTANQSNAETNTTGVTSSWGTLTRNTSAPLVGTADFKLVADGGGDASLSVTSAVTAGRWYAFQVFFNTYHWQGGHTVHLRMGWYNASGWMSNTMGGAVAAEGVPTHLSVIGQAPAGATVCDIRIYLDLSISGEVLWVDSLMLEAIPTTLTVWTSAHNKLTIDMGYNLLQWNDQYANLFLALPAAYMSGAVIDVVLFDDTSHAVTLAVHPAGGAWTTNTGTLAALTWPQLTLGNLEGGIANLIEYGYVLTSAEYQALAYSSLSLLFNSLYAGNRYAGEIIKGSDKRLLNAAGSDISALLGGTDIAIGSAAVTIAQTQGLAARWYVELKRTDV